MFGEVVDRINDSDDVELTARFRELELLSRQIDAEMAAIVHEGDRRNIGAIDGHRTIASWQRAHTNCPTAVASRRTRLGRLLANCPRAAEALHGGQIGAAQAGLLARIHANPRCGGQVLDAADVLVDLAEHLSFDDFAVCARRFELLADADGAHDDREASIERTAFVAELDGSVVVSASGGSALDAAEFIAVFEAQVQAEFRRDVAERTRLHGPDAPTSLLPRTDGQRRFDALLHIFRGAAQRPRTSEAPAPVPATVNIVVDQRTAETSLAQHGLCDHPVDLGDLDLVDRRCETADGIVLVGDDIVRSALTGHIRRVVINSAGVITDFGRRRRLFTGTAREAAKLMAHRCDHRGCTVKATFSEVDHLHEWSDDGATDVESSSNKCGPHNRFAWNARYRTKRDHRGRMVTFRPDGTPLLPAGCRPPTDADFVTDDELVALARRRAADLAHLRPG
jgi:hypothetical protein